MSNLRGISGVFQRGVAARFVLGAALVLGGCSSRLFVEDGRKDDEHPVDKVESQVSIEGIELKRDPIRFDRLHFETIESVLTTLDALENESALGGDSVLENFEKALGFRSLRAHVERSVEERLEAGWDGQERLDDEFVAWEALRTVLNVDRQRSAPHAARRRHDALDEARRRRSAFSGVERRAPHDP